MDAVWHLAAWIELVRIWTIDTNSCVAVLDGHNDCVWEVRWSQDAKAIASASKDQTIRVWDTANWSCLANPAWQWRTHLFNSLGMRL
jgi:WD40 repeat protein